MSSARSVLVAATLVASVGSCKNTSSTPLAPGAAGAAPAADDGAQTVAGPAGSKGEKIKIVASLEGLEDMMVTVKDVSGRLSVEGDVDPLADMQATFLQLGFAPGFLGNIDLDGLHAFAFALPDDEEASPSDVELAGSISVVSAKNVIESTPAAFRPQPLGDGIWEFKQDDERVLLRDAGKELYVGLSDADLDRAAGLRGEVGKGRRVRARAWNIPTDAVDPADLLGLPRSMPLMKHLSTVLKQLESVELELDLGSKRPLEVMASAKAPFSELGIEPLGKPRATSTKVEKLLPGDPIFAATMSWGDPAMVHKMIDKQVPIDRIPAPFGDVVKSALTSGHAVLDQIASDVVLAVYVDKRGRATAVLVADIKDAAKTKAALRTVHEQVQAGAKLHAGLQGKNENAKFKVDYKPDGARLKGTKGDRVSITIPKDFRGDLDEAALFMNKNTIDLVSMAEGNVAMLAIGANAAGLAGDVSGAIAKAPKESLATDTSLGKVREVMGGCQVCIVADVPDYLAFRLELISRNSTDKAITKDAKAALGKLRKVGELGDAAFGIRVLPEEGTIAAVVPESAMFAEEAKLVTLADVNRFVMGPEAGLEWTEDKPVEKASGATKPKAPESKQ